MGLNKILFSSRKLDKKNGVYDSSLVGHHRTVDYANVSPKDHERLVFAATQNYDKHKRKAGKHAIDREEYINIYINLLKAGEKNEDIS